MNAAKLITFSLLLALGAESSAAQAQTPPNAVNSVGARVDPYVARQRLLVLTDIANEPDDQMSLVRLLVYSNQLDIEGLVAATSTWMKRAVRPDVIRQVIDAYAQVQPNLSTHEPGFPTADALRAVVTTGQPGYGMDAVGPDRMSPGAELIIRSVDRADSRPLWVTAWGGANTLAQALLHVRATRSPTELARFVAKLRVYTISDQDDAGPWIRREFPTLHYIASPSTQDGAQYYMATWTGISGDRFYRNAPGADFTTFTDEWVNANIRAKGPLGAHYPRPCCIHEGDTPAFLGLTDNGLASAMSPAFGGWGGRYVWRRFSGETRPHWTQGGDAYPGNDNSRDAVIGADGKTYVSDQATIWRWGTAFQHDFAARMDWSVKSPRDANHNPLVTVNGNAGRAPIEITAHVGVPITLDASGTRDPDGNALKYSWFFYPEAGTGIPGRPVFAGGRAVYDRPPAAGNAPGEGGIPSAPAGGLPTPRARVTIADANAAKTTITPQVAGIAHIILAVEDDGAPSLTSYRRVILDIQPASGSNRASAPTTPSATVTAKPRVVVTTDPELDDSNSLLRYLLYSTDFRTEGIVYASSQFHWKGDGTGKKDLVPNREYTRFGVNLCPCESWRWAPGERFIDDAVDIYERVYPNLRVHRPDYPDPATLRSKIRWGNIEFDGDISKETPGSNLIRDLLLDDNDEPIYLLAWGGASTISRALKSIQERDSAKADWPAIRARISRKAILGLSGDQDDTYAKYIRPNWPDIKTLATGQGGVGLGYGAFVFASAENAPYFSTEWTRENVSSRGPIGAHYRVWGDGKQMVPGDRFDYFGVAGQTSAELRAKGYVVWLPPRPKGEFLGEGDTFTYLNLIGNGLSAYRDSTPGGWAGRVVVNPATKAAAPRPTQAGGTTSFGDFMRRVEEAGAAGPAERPQSPQPNFTPAAQNDFAARMQWSVTPTLAGANHEPVVAVRQTRVSARPGEMVRLEGTASDPDRNALTVKWWRWKDVDTYPGEVSISSAASLATSIQVPTDAVAGQTIQLVLEVTDDGKPALTRYQRVVVSVTR